jgi:hypothetical protein
LNKDFSGMAEERESPNGNDSPSESEGVGRTSSQDEGFPSGPLLETRREITEEFSMLAGVSGQLVNPIIDKVTSEHISKTIDNAEAENKRESEAGYSIRRYTFLYFVVGLSAVLALIIFFGVREQWAVISSIVTGILGFGGGFGLGRSRH